MPYVLVTDFKLGLDKRRMAVASPPGTLQTAKNAHINRGGEVEKAKAFVSTYTLPANTFGMRAAGDSLYVFGSVADPGVPSGVTYQRLQHPDGLTMTALVASEVYSGLVYAIAEFSDGKRYHFYDGVLVGDWYEGVVRSTMTNMAGVATHLAGLINADADYAASSVGSVITITGPLGRDVVTTVLAENGGTFTDQGITVVETTDGLPSISEVKAAGAFTIYGGSESAGVNTIAAITVNGVSVIASALNFSVSPEVTAQNIANAITTHNSTPEYTATAVGSTVTINAAVGSGSTPNGYVVSVTVTGNVILCTGSFSITDGSSGANTVSSVKVNGSAITTGSTSWTTSHSNTAALIVTNINANSGTSGYNAYSDPGSSEVLIGKLVVTGTSPGGLSLEATSTGDVRINAQTAAGKFTTNLNSAVVNMRNGVAAYAGTADVWTVTLSGTFDPGDKFTVFIEDPIRGTLEFGASRVAGLLANAVLRTHNKKLYTASGSVLAFSGVADPRGFGTDATGAGTINVADEFNGSVNVSALAPYQGQLSVFSRNAIQIWNMDPDPSLNIKVQVISNQGALSAESVKPFGDSDVFYLSDSGVRSLRARSSTDTATVFDVGTPIDDLIIENLRTLSESQAAASVAELEPTSGRYMLQLGTTIYVFTYFPGGKISAWSTYEPGISFSTFSRLRNKLYARSGDTIYLLGGTDNNTYSASETVVELPFLDGRQIATWKNWHSVDFALEGTWDVYLATDPNNPSIEDYVGQFSATTVTMMTIPIVTDGPLLKLRFVSTTAAYGRVSMVVAHYKGGVAE
jgi:hypothetical protein